MSSTTDMEDKPGEKSEASSDKIQMGEPDLTKPQPVDGGAQAWLQVLGSFFLFFNTWGFVNAFGAYNTFYRTDFLSNYSSSAVSWIGTVDSFLLIVGGVLTGPLFDRGHFRSMLITGAIIFVFGVMMLSLSDKYYQIFLTQGVLLGIGSGLLYVPSLALVAGAFTKRRSLAIGLATSGTSVGGVVYPIMFRRLQPTIGFGWATRCMGFLSLFCFLISFCIMLPKKTVAAKQSRKLFEPTALTDVPFVMFTIGGFLIFIGFWVPYFYIASYARLLIGEGLDMSFYDLAIVNGASFFGRVIPGYIADKVGPLQTLIASAAASGVLILSWIAVHDATGLTVWAIFWGFFSGILVSVPAAVVPLLCPSKDVIGTRLGMAWAGAAIGILIGNPIAGAIAGSDLGNFTAAQGFAGAVMLLGAMCDIIPMVAIIRRARA